MKTIRDLYTRKTTSALSSHIDHDYVIQKHLQPELSYNQFNTFFSSQLGPQTCFNPCQQNQQTARQKLRQFTNLKKVNTLQNFQLTSKELQPTKTQIFHPKLKGPSLKTYSKLQSLQLDQENNFNSLNLASTQRSINKLQDSKSTQKYLDNQRLINLELKQETQNLRTQIYQLRNVQIQLEKIKIYVRKLQNQLNDQASIVLDLKSQNQQLLNKLCHFQDLLQLKIKDFQSLETDLIQTKRTINQLNQQKSHNQQSYQQEKQQKDTKIKQIQKQCYEKSNLLSELYQQIQRLALQVDGKQKQNSELFGNYEEALEVIDKIQQKMRQMQNQQAQSHKTWEEQVHRNEILFMKMQKAIQDKSRQTSLIQTELKELKSKLKKLQMQQKREINLKCNEIKQLKEQNEVLKREIETHKQTKLNENQHDEQSLKKQYVPKKWFEEKICYEYRLNSLQNQLQNLKQWHEELLNSRQKDTINQAQQKFIIPIKSITQGLRSSQTQTESIHLGEIQFQQSEKSRLIQEQEVRILCLEKQLNQLYTELDHQKNRLEQKYSQKLILQQGKCRQLQQKYSDQREKLLKQKQRTQDLTMELLLLNQQIQESRVKIKSKEHL